MVLTLTAIVVLVIDQALKLVLRAGSVRVVEGRLWVTRVRVNQPNALWLWILPAVALLVTSAWLPSSSVFVGLLLGGSLSNALEGSLRGSVTDYVRLRFWPAFNFADVAIAAGAVGIAFELLRTLSG